MKAIRVLCKDNVDEVLENPSEYVDETFDLPLVEINKILIMVGKNEEDGRYYLVVEDDETSQDYYLNENESLIEKYEWLLEKELL